MGIISTLSDTLSATETQSGDESQAEASAGAYWCDDCNVRIRDIEVEDRGLNHDDEGTPQCPDCGESMRFERSHADGCAC